MKIKTASTLIASTALLSMLGLSQVFAGERPPANAKPLVEIINELEKQGYSPITEISLDDGIWEVEAYKDNQARELKLEPSSGKILSDRRDD
jgi:uncharacterized membrane protein YkoI